MPTITVKSIGATGRDYSTIQAWEDACPANIVTSDEIWKGECHDDSEFVVSNTEILTASGITTDDTRFLWLTTAAGKGFADDAGAASWNLRYDTSVGVAVRTTGNYSGGFNCGSVRVLIEGLQIKFASSWGNSSMFSGSNCMRRCLIDSEKGNTSTNNGRLINCLIVDLSIGFHHAARADAVLIACTIVRPSDASSAGTAVTNSYSLYPSLKSCAVFGFATNFGGTIASYVSSNNNASNSSSVPGTSAQASLTYTDQFENTTNSTRDWRVKAGSSLISNGSRHQGTEGTFSALGTNDLDILGRSRSTTTPTIGCWEVIGGGGGGGKPYLYYSMQRAQVH